MSGKQKIRTEVAKGSEVRFISHLDFMNTITRALRRAELPIAFSQGYNPRPQLSFASALAVGLTSNSEYIDFELQEAMMPQKFKNQLNREFPAGIRIKEAQEVPVDSKSLMAVINAGRYFAKLEFTEELSKGELEKIIDDFLGQEELEIKRKRRNKSDRWLDLKPMIFSLTVMGVQEKEGTINMLVQTGSSGNVRPQEVIRALAQRYEVIKPPKMINIHRAGLYIKDGENLQTPMET